MVLECLLLYKKWYSISIYCIITYRCSFIHVFSARKINGIQTVRLCTFVYKSSFILVPSIIKITVRFHVSWCISVVLFTLTSKIDQGKRRSNHPHNTRQAKEQHSDIVQSPTSGSNTHVWARGDAMVVAAMWRGAAGSG